MSQTVGDAGALIGLPHDELRDRALFGGGPGGDDHAQPPAGAQHDRAADARRGGGRGRPGGARRRGEGDRASAARDGRSAPATTSAAASSTGASARDRRRAGIRARTSWSRPRRELSPTQKLMSVWRSPEAGDRPGPRLVRRRRQRLRAVRRPRRGQRGRGDRHALQPHVGRVPVGHVDLPARAGPRQGARADRPAAQRPRGRGRRADQPGRAFAELEADRRGAGRRPRPHPGLPARRDEARRQPRLREHGPRLHADAGADPRRAHAQHARRAGVHRAAPRPRACARWSPSATGRSATTARRRRELRPDPRTSSSRRLRRR